MARSSEINHSPFPVYDLSGTIPAGGAILIAPIWPTRSWFQFSNNGTHNMFLTLGGATASCALSGGAVNTVTVVNAGLNYSYAPLVRFVGGGYATQSQIPTRAPEGLGLGAPGGPQPSGPNAASAHCVMAGGAGALTVSSIVLDNKGSGYQIAPLVLLENDPRDPVGSALPSSTSGIVLPPIATSTGPMIMGPDFCPTVQIAIAGTVGDQFTCYMAA